MILSRVEIENYKQYADRHEIDIPSVATIGVIGNNGVGKTTLFEAIEWCLYNPPSIRSKDIRPRGRSGFTKVTVTLHDPKDGRQFIVERELKRASTVGAIYEVDATGTETVIVQGTKPVSDYVSTKLIGLGHQAFVATFFTRQKELSFFGNLGDSDRRREVSRLLGLETIRNAQQSIAEDRKRMQADAASYRRQYDEQTSGRDFTAEMTTARETIAQRNVVVVDAGKRATIAADEVRTHDSERLRVEALRDLDVGFVQQLTETEGKQATRTQQLSQIEQELERLTRRAAERTVLLPRADCLVSLNAQVEALEAQRQRFLRKRELDQTVQELTQRRLAILQTLASTVQGIPVADPRSDTLRNWVWTNGDHQDPIAGVLRLIDIAHQLDLAGAVAHEQHIRHALDASRALIEANDKLEKYQVAQERLNVLLAQAMQDGDPAETILTLSRKREGQQHEISAIAVGRTQHDLRLKQAEALIENLDHQHFDDHCPTCARPFSSEDAAIVLVSLRGQVNVIQETMRRDQVRAADVQTAIATLERERTAQETRSKEIAELGGRINNSISFVEDQQAFVQRSSDLLAESIRATGIASVPSQNDLARAKERVTLYRQITECLRPLSDASAGLARIDTERGKIEPERILLNNVAFDDAEYRSVSNARQDADRATTAVGQIDRELERQSQLLTDKAGALEQGEELVQLISRLIEQRKANGFQADHLSAIQTRLQASRTAEREALDERHAAQMVLRDANQALESLEKDQERIAGLAGLADERQRQADSSDRMYREFTEFDKFAAAHYTPILGDMTSELVREVTDGKYDRVEFDSNYGIEIFDGTEEHFPLATFSGGERDAIALCARIALSRMIGSQAVSPPGFLVLDEVFGSLDRDRRTRLLDMLGAISTSGESFQQMFIISHVDDVRTAPIFDELWRIEETAVGESRLLNLAAGTEIDDL